MKTYYVGRVQPHSEELFEESRAKLLELAGRDKERMMLEEAKNKVESYIYKIKNTLMDNEEAVEKVSTQKERDEAKKLAGATEEWLYEDGYTADLAAMEGKFAEISAPFEKILLRISESTERPKAIDALEKQLTEIDDLMAKWEESKPQVTDDERKSVLKMVTEARKWVEEKEKAQSAKKAHEEPAYLSSEVPLQLKPIGALVVRLDRKPKPKPPKKNETSSENATAVDANSTAGAADINSTSANANSTSANVTGTASNSTGTAANVTAATEDNTTSSANSAKVETAGADGSTSDDASKSARGAPTTDKAAPKSSFTKVPADGGVDDEL